MATPMTDSRDSDMLFCTATSTRSLSERAGYRAISAVARDASTAGHALKVVMVKSLCGSAFAAILDTPKPVSQIPPSATVRHVIACLQWTLIGRQSPIGAHREKGTCVPLSILLRFPATLKPSIDVFEKGVFTRFSGPATTKLSY